MYAVLSGHFFVEILLAAGMVTTGALFLQPTNTAVLNRSSNRKT